MLTRKRARERARSPSSDDAKSWRSESPLTDIEDSGSVRTRKKTIVAGRNTNRAPTSSSGSRQTAASSASVTATAATSQSSRSKRNRVTALPLISPPIDGRVKVGEASNNACTTGHNSKVTLGQASILRGAPVVPDLYGLCLLPDDENEKVYTLVNHGDHSRIHCLDLKQKQWHSFDDLSFEGCQQALPPCHMENLAFCNGCVLIFGGYIGHLPQQRPRRRFIHDTERMTVLIVDIAQRTWRVLRALSDDGEAPPPRYLHVSVCVGNEVFIFGGRRTIPEKFIERDFDDKCPREDIYRSYVNLKFDPVTTQWHWKTVGTAYPDNVGNLGYALDAIRMNTSRGDQATNRRAPILVTPGISPGNNTDYLNIDQFCFFDPHTKSFTTWVASTEPLSKPGNAFYLMKAVSTESVVFALISDNADTIEFYHYMCPPFTSRSRTLGKIGLTGSKERSLVGLVKGCAFAGCMDIAEKMYVLAKDSKEALNILVEVTFNLDG